MGPKAATPLFDSETECRLRTVDIQTEYSSMIFGQSEVCTAG